MKYSNGRIRFVEEGRWVASYKEKDAWSYVYAGEGADPVEAFGRLPFTAGIQKNVVFEIKFGEVER